MKRGLVVLDPGETSPAAFAARVDGLRERLEEAGAAAGLIYGDVSRSGDIQYLTNLCLYWNEAVLAVPVRGEPALITKLSKRVQPWMRQTSTLRDIRSGPRLAEGIAAFLDERGIRSSRTALVDMPWWPAALVARLRDALPGAQLQDLPAAVRDRRLVPSSEEWSLLSSGARRLEEAMDAAWALGGDPHERTSIAVRNIRRAGFQDAAVTCGTLPDGSELADAVCQYHYVWLRQSLPRGGPAAALATRTLEAVLGAATPGATEARLARLAADRIGEGYEVVLSCMPHPDIETRGLFRPEADAQRPLREGEVVCITLSLAGAVGVLSASRTVEVGSGGGSPLFSKENA